MKTFELNGEHFEALGWDDLTGRDFARLAEHMNSLVKAAPGRAFTEAVSAILGMLITKSEKDLSAYSKGELLQIVSMSLRDLEGLSGAFHRFTEAALKIMQNDFQERAGEWVHSKY